VADPGGPDRRERLLSLLAALLESRAGLTREEILTNPAFGYPPGPTASRRAFERDKARLRAMGVPVHDETDNNVTRYRVPPSEYYLPALDLSSDELAALHVAVTAVGLGSAAGEGTLMKLGGVEGAGAMPIAELPAVEALAPLFEASRRRAVVRFDYRGRRRRLQPWGLTSKFGHWYVVGLDLDASEMRVYRADRIAGDVEVGRPREFSVPHDFRADAYLEDQPWQFGGGPPMRVRIRVDRGYETELVARAESDADVTVDGDSVVVELSVVNLDALRSFVLGFLDRAEVLSPPEARAAMVSWLEAIAATAPGDPR
jgi:predicted DNA-binding transcriptional regulator YafY